MLFIINTLMLSALFKRSRHSIRELKQLRRRHQRQLQKNNRFNDQNNSSARASRYLVHFFDVHCTTTTWNLLIWRFMGTWTYGNSPGKVACIWHIERVQIDAIKFERAQINFFNRRFHCRRRRPCLRSLLSNCVEPCRKLSCNPLMPLIGF